MLKNYFTIALRNLWKNRVFSFINIAGLALGMAAFLLILEYIGFEQSTNRFHQQLPQLYRVMLERSQTDNFPFVMPGLGPVAQQQFAEVKGFCRIAETAQGIVAVAHTDSLQTPRSFRENNIAYADGSFFRMFTFPLRQGGQTALDKPNSVAISEAFATKYFGTEPALGKILIMHNQYGQTPYTVTGIYQNMPANSTIQYDMLLSLKTLENPANLNGNTWSDLTSFETQFIYTYLWVQEDAQATTLERKLQATYRQRMPHEKLTIRLQPAAHMHLARSLGDYLQTTGNLRFIYLLGGLSVLILAIAWFNYINLSTAGSLKRAKEVGIRKAIGASKSQLIGQFLGESVWLNVISGLLALLLVASVQPAINALIGKQLSVQLLLSGGFWLFGLGFLMAGSLISGGYIAFALTSFQPIQTLKGVFSKSSKGIWLRQTLVVAQFSISIALMAGTFVLYRQLQYMQQKNLGMNLDQLLVIKGPELGEAANRKQANEVFINQIKQLSYVKNYTNSGAVPGDYNFSAAGITSQNPLPDDDKKLYSICYIDDQYLPTYQIATAAGQPFTAELCRKPFAERRKVMLNEKAVEQLGFRSVQEAVGKKIRWSGMGETDEYEITGIVKNYHHRSLHQAIDPILFFPAYNTSYLTLRLTTDQIQPKMGELEKLFQAAFPGNPFEYFFMDESYNKQYTQEQQYGQLFTTASVIAIFIACMGLFGLATFTLEQRTKEIGIRKILGASVTHLVSLVSRDFLKLVCIAFGISIPVVWYGMNLWLQNFAYKVPLSWWIFAIAGFLAFLIAFLTIGIKALKAALANPVESLRTE